MRTFLLLLLIIGCNAVLPAPSFFELQGQDVYCYLHTTNNIIGSEFFDASLVYKLAKNQNKQQHALFNDDDYETKYMSTDCATSSGCVASAISITQDGSQYAPLLMYMFGIAGYSFKPTAEQIHFRTELSGIVIDPNGRSDENLETLIRQHLAKGNFRGYTIHLDYSQEWTHFTSITLDPVNGNYYYLDPSFPVVDPSVAKAAWHECTGVPHQYPMLIAHPGHDCRRLKHYGDVYFNYLVSRPLGAGAGGITAVVNRLIELKGGITATIGGTPQILSSMIWMVPIFEMTDANYLSYMNNHFNYWQNPTAIRYQANNGNLVVSDKYLKRQKNLWKSPRLLRLLRAEYHTNRAGGTGFYSAIDTVDNTAKITTKTCTVPDTDPTGAPWTDDETVGAKLAEWRRQRPDECNSQWRARSEFYNYYMYGIEDNDYSEINLFRGAQRARIQSKRNRGYDKYHRLKRKKENYYD